MTQRPKPFITSVRVMRSAAAHEWVNVFIRGQLVGTLCVGEGDGAQLERMLLGADAAAPDHQHPALHPPSGASSSLLPPFRRG